MPLRSEHISFLGELDVSCFLSLGHHVLVLNSHNTSSPGSSECDVVVEGGSEVALEIGEVCEVFLSNIGESNTGGCPGAAELSKSCFTFDETEWNVVLSAESWQENHDLEWVNVVSHNNKLGFAFFDEGSNVVETKFEMEWFWSGVA